MYRRQSLLDQLDCFLAPSPETIVAVSDHFKTYENLTAPPFLIPFIYIRVKGGDLVVLLQILEVLLYRCATTDRDLPVVELIGDVVLPRAR